MFGTFLADLAALNYLTVHLKLSLSTPPRQKQALFVRGTRRIWFLFPINVSPQHMVGWAECFNVLLPDH